jgi:hypothetical protein
VHGARDGACRTLEFKMHEDDRGGMESTDAEAPAGNRTMVPV